MNLFPVRSLVSALLASQVVTLPLPIVPSPVGPATAEERAVIEVVLNDPDPGLSSGATTYGCRGLNPEQTLPDRLDREHARMQLPDTLEWAYISDELLASYRERNMVSVSIEGVRISQGSLRRAICVVSRPGMSVDGSKAVVTVREQSHGSGYFAYLEKHDGVWRLVARGGFYIA